MRMSQNIRDITKLKGRKTLDLQYCPNWCYRVQKYSGQLESNWNKSYLLRSGRLFWVNGDFGLVVLMVANSGIMASGSKFLLLRSNGGGTGRIYKIIFFLRLEVYTIGTCISSYAQ